MKLTHKQEQFVLGLIKGKSQRQAFIDAGYSTKNKTDSYIDIEASKMAKKPKIVQRFEELRAEVAKESKWTRKKAFEEYEWLKNKAKNEIDKHGVKKSTADAFLDSLEGMNKMALGSDALANKKIEKEIQMLQTRIDAMTQSDEETQESKLEYLIKQNREVIEHE